MISNHVRSAELS